MSFFVSLAGKQLEQVEEDEPGLEAGQVPGIAQAGRIRAARPA